MTKPLLIVLSGPKGDSRSIGAGIIETAVLCFCLFFTVGTPAQQKGPAGTGQGSKPTFTTFEAPGAGKGMRQGTVPVSIQHRRGYHGIRP